MNNPFTVKTPESLKPKEVADLFVDVYNDFSPIQDISHTFIHGARGTGKSMMLRFMEPLVQVEAKTVEKISELEFYAVHVPIKLSNLNFPEAERLKGSAFNAMAEHMLLMHVCSRIFSSLLELNVLDKEELTKLFEVFVQQLQYAGGEAEYEKGESLPSICDKEFSKVIQYVKRLSFSTDHINYQGPLCGYIDFLIPIIKTIRQFNKTPNGPLFLMLDDADNLSVGMQSILNSWVSCRTTENLCLKISTQMRYRTWRTTSKQLIEAPHDYSEVDINTIYTSNVDNYRKRIEEIITKRLSLANIDSTPEQFFPLNQKQESALVKIRKEIKEKWEKGERKGHRSSDDVTRYATPEYMRRLGGKSKSSSTYSYAGFKSLVNLSSGIVRWYLEPAARMYNEAKIDNRDLDCISPGIQDKIIQSWSEQFLLSDFEKLKVDETTDTDNEASSKVKMLYTLICSLGGLFRDRLMDDSLSEQRVISIMVKPDIPDDLNLVIKLGIEWSYFHLSTIGAKEGLGRNKQLILNRRLAPYFRLDPTGYAAYVQVTEHDLRLACTDTAAFLRSRSQAKSDDKQLPLMSE